MAINNQEPNEIYPVQTFLKEEMLKDTNVLKELDQKKENMDSTSIATTLLIESFKQALRSEAKMRAFKKYFAKYNKRAESIQFSNEQIARNEEASDITESLRDDTLEANEKIEKSNKDDENPEDIPVEDLITPEQIDAFFDALDDLINDESLKDKKTVEKFKTQWQKPNSPIEKALDDQIIKENLKTAKWRMRELRRNVQPVPKPEFVRAEITEADMKKGLYNAQRDIMVLTLRNPEAEIPQIFNTHIPGTWGQWHNEFRMENFSDYELKQLQEGIYSLEQQARAAVMTGYQKFTNHCSELKKEIFGDANVPTPQPTPGHTIERHGDTEEIMPDNQQTQSISNQAYNGMRNILINIENMFQQFFSYGQAASDLSSSVDQTATDTAQTSSTAPTPTPKPKPPTEQ